MPTKKTTKKAVTKKAVTKKAVTKRAVAKKAPATKATAKKPAKKTRAKTTKPARAPLSRDAVLAAAVRLADVDGLDALTMRGLATALEVEAMSLYHHVANKEAILDGLVEHVVAELPVPLPLPDWRDMMRARAVAAHAVLLRHPWATPLFVSRVNVGPRMLRYVDATIAGLRAAGFSWADADHVWNVVDAFVYGFTLQTAHFPLEPAAYVSSAQAFLPMIPAAQYPGLHGLSVEVIEGRHDGLQHLRFGLELLLDGIEHRRRCTPPGGSVTTTTPDLSARR